MERTRIVQWLNLLVCALLLLNAEGSTFVPITYLESAVSKGAVCLDGSPPAYHFDQGSGEGSNSWIVHLELWVNMDKIKMAHKTSGTSYFSKVAGSQYFYEAMHHGSIRKQPLCINIEGGGWCNDVGSCLDRKGTRRGSSTQMAEQIAFYGLLSDQQKNNPDFYNWNRIKVRYCDGSSFTGDVEEVDPKTNLHFRGARIFVAVIEELLAKGMKNAENAILSGCSAGGLATILHCDRFKDLLPSGTNVKCVPDAGYFINAGDVSGTKYIEQFYSQVVETHGSAKNLPSSCTSKLSPGLCFFPQNVASGISTPIFVVNAAYDSWQIKNILARGDADPHGYWKSCRINLNNCSPDQLSMVQDFRAEFLKALSVLGNNSSEGMFIDSCYVHCQTEMQETWFGSDSPELSNTTIAKAVGDWFYGRKAFHGIDCAYPCNPTCGNHVSDLQAHPGI